MVYEGKSYRFRIHLYRRPPELAVWSWNSKFHRSWKWSESHPGLKRIHLFETYFYLICDSMATAISLEKSCANFAGKKASGSKPTVSAGMKHFSSVDIKKSVSSASVFPRREPNSSRKPSFSQLSAATQELVSEQTFSEAVNTSFPFPFESKNSFPKFSYSCDLSLYTVPLVLTGSHKRGGSDVVRGYDPWPYLWGHVRPDVLQRQDVRIRTFVQRTRSCFQWIHQVPQKGRLCNKVKSTPPQLPSFLSPLPV